MTNSYSGIQLLFILLISVFLIEKIKAQDPFFTTFYNKRSLYNPAAVGLENSLSFRAYLKSQWQINGSDGYETAAIILEDALPCRSNFDWGLSIIADREGSGRFSTYQGAFRTSYSLTELIPSLFSQHNMRLGAEVGLGQHTIDYSRLTFSDQIDPKYGFVNPFGVANPTTFIPPNGGTSPLYFNPGFGILLQSRWNKKSAQSFITNIGASINNSFSLGGDNTGNTSSVLGLSNQYRQIRYNLHGEMSLIPFYRNDFFLSISPLFFFQKQGPIHYWEIGTSVDVSSLFEVGIFTHNTSFLIDDNSTNWLSFTGKINLRSSKESRIVLDFTYSMNYKGLQNQVGPIFEVGIIYHMGRSIGCSLLGRDDEVLYNDKPHCPIMSISPAKRKMYENVWYRN